MLLTTPVFLLALLACKRYFDAPKSQATVRHAFAAPPSTHAAASTFLRRVRALASVRFVAGMQLRLGDKENNPDFVAVYPKNNWTYFIEGVKAVVAGGGATPATTAVVITAGGSVGSNKEDMALARNHISILFPGYAAVVSRAVGRACNQGLGLKR